MFHHLGRRLLCLTFPTARTPSNAVRRGVYPIGSFARSICLPSQAMPRRRSFAQRDGVRRSDPVTAFSSAGSAGLPGRRASSSSSFFVMSVAAWCEINVLHKLFQLNGKGNTFIGDKPEQSEVCISTFRVPMPPLGEGFGECFLEAFGGCRKVATLPLRRAFEGGLAGSAPGADAPPSGARKNPILA